MFGRKNEQEPDFIVFTIHDSKSQSYDVPSFAKNKDVLLRDVLNMFNDPKQAENRFLVNAEDYSIFKIGYYSKSTGKIESCNAEHICNLIDLRSMSNWSRKPDMGIVPT
nr:MAG: nonstructural protein [Microvirus sp.]